VQLKGSTAGLLRDKAVWTVASVQQLATYESKGPDCLIWSRTRSEDEMKAISFLGRLCISPLPVPPSWYAVPLRLIVGVGFIEHGYAKLTRGADGFIAILHALGAPFADLLGWATIVVEIVGGAMILLGALVPLAAVPMIVVLLVAIFTVHISNGFSSIKLLSYDAMGAHFGQPGYETDLLYIAGLLALCVGGAGPLSLDGYLSVRRSHSRPLRPRPVIGNL
jgi:putative oxidoreductase